MPLWGKYTRSTGSSCSAPALVTSIFLTMAISFDEFVVAWFVTGLDVTLPVKIYAMLGGDVSPKINAIGSIAFGISVTLVLIAQLVWELNAKRSLRQTA